MFRRLAPLAVALTILLAACTSAGTPNSYDDQDGLVERNFRETCEEALAGDEADPASYCQCAFYTIAAELTFAEFLDLDNKLEDDPEAFSREERNLLESVSLPCSFSDADINRTVETS